MSNIKVFPIKYDSQVHSQTGGSHNFNKLYEYPNFTPKIDLSQEPKVPEITIKQSRNQYPFFFNKPRKPVRIDLELQCDNLEEENKSLKEQIIILKTQNLESQKKIDELTQKLEEKLSESEKMKSEVDGAINAFPQ
jgi:hypothetical protein